MYAKMLIANQKPEYLVKYGFSSYSENLLDIQAYKSQSEIQMETITNTLIDDDTASYTCECFIDALNAEPLDENRLYTLSCSCRNIDNSELSEFKTSPYTYKAQKKYQKNTVAVPENTNRIAIRLFRYPNSNPNYTDVNVTGIQLYKQLTPLPDNSLEIKSLVTQGNYYIEYNSNKYEFVCPELNGVSEVRDILYFDKHKKTAHVIKKLERHTLDNVTIQNVGVSSYTWQRDGYTSVYITNHIDNKATTSDTYATNAIYSNFNAGKWVWSGLDDGNYAFARGNLFYIIIDNSYTQITSGDTDDEKKEKIVAWLADNPIDMVYTLATPKKISIPLKKVDETNAIKIELWEE